DVSFRLPPISREEALEMIAETKIHTLLAGVRGEKPSDIESVADVLVRVSQLALDFQDRVLEMDLNPVFVYEEGKGSIAVDVKVTLSG
ncbi:MAG: acetate--CoA ligase family protein, partial [Aigarchaeota archaeon]|nr:acetate--CoA ligase family protein [Aigarchaeota archaeon]